MDNMLKKRIAGMVMACCLAVTYFSDISVIKASAAEVLRWGEADDNSSTNSSLMIEFSEPVELLDKDEIIVYNQDRGVFTEVLDVEQVSETVQNIKISDEFGGGEVYRISIPKDTKSISGIKPKFYSAMIKSGERCVTANELQNEYTDDFSTWNYPNYFDSNTGKNEYDRGWIVRSSNWWHGWRQSARVRSIKYNGEQEANNKFEIANYWHANVCFVNVNAPVNIEKNAADFVDVAFDMSYQSLMEEKDSEAQIIVSDEQSKSTAVLVSLQDGVVKANDGTTKAYTNSMYEAENFKFRFDTKNLTVQPYYNGDIFGDPVKLSYDVFADGVWSVDFRLHKYTDTIYTDGSEPDNVNCLYIDNFSVDTMKSVKTQATELEYLKNDETNVIAWADFTNAASATAVKKGGFSKVEFGTTKTVKTETVDGATYWELQTSDSKTSSYINFAISDSVVKDIKDGRAYKLYIDYLDSEVEDVPSDEEEGLKGKSFFALEYDSVGNTNKFGDITYLENSGMWKTAVIDIDDARFKNAYSWTYDFRLTTYCEGATFPSSRCPVVIKGVRLVEEDYKALLFASASTDEVGNAFEDYKEEKIISTTITNKSDKHINATLKLKAVLGGKRTAFETTKEVTLDAGETLEFDTALNLSECGLYDWVVEAVSADADVKTEQDTIKFAIIKTDPNGILNESVFIDEKLKDPTKAQIDEMLDLVKKSNAGGIRTGFNWINVQPTADSEISIAGTKEELFAKSAKEHGLKVQWLLSNGHEKITGKWSNWPLDATTQAEYLKYAEYAAKNSDISEVAAGIEIGNEPDVSSFNNNKMTDVQYAELIKAVASKIKSVSDIPVNAYSFTGLIYGKNETWLNTGIANGALENIDNVTYHPYDWFEPVELSAKSTGKKAEELTKKIQAVNPDAKMAVSEQGVSRQFKYISSDREQGAATARTVMYYQVRDLARYFTVFKLNHVSALEQSHVEDGFGLVKSANSKYADDSGKVLVPTDAYLSFAAMNYILADSTPLGVYDLGENVAANGFMSNKFGARVLTLNTCEDRASPREEKYQMISLNLGTNKITFYDDFGNAKEITSTDGIYKFSLDERPIYIVGNIKDPTLATSGVGIEKNEITLKKGESEKIEVFGNSNYTVDVKATDNIDYSFEKIANGTGYIKLTDKTGEGAKTTPVVITVYDGNNVVFRGDVTVKPDKGDIYVTDILTNRDLTPAENAEWVRLTFSSVPTQQIVDNVVLKDKNNNIIDAEKSLVRNVLTLSFEATEDVAYIGINQVIADDLSFEGFAYNFPEETDQYNLWYLENEEEMVVGIDVPKNKARSGNYKFMFAGYEGEAMTDAGMGDLNFETGKNFATSEIRLKNSGTTGKAFVFESLETLRPILDSRTIQK